MENYYLNFFLYKKKIKNTYPMELHNSAKCGFCKSANDILDGTAKKKNRQKILFNTAYISKKKKFLFLKLGK